MSARVAVIAECKQFRHSQPTRDKSQHRQMFLFGKTHEYDGDVGVLLLELLDMRDQLESLLVVTVAHTRVHELRRLEDLEQLRVARQRQRVHPAAARACAER